MSRFRSDINNLLNEIAYDYSFVCVDYMREVGKFGVAHNTETIQWGARSRAVRNLRKNVKLLNVLCLTDSPEERYLVMRELYMIKPGVHEQYYFRGHEGRVLQHMQQWFINPNTSMKAKASYFLKSILVIENFYGLSPFFDVSPRMVYPTNNLEAQQVTKAFLEDCVNEPWYDMTPLNNWFNYAPCAVNEGPCVFRLSEDLFLMQHDELLAKHVVPYKEILDGHQAESEN